MNKEQKNMRSESRLLQPAIIIGKNGFTDNVIKNINAELKKSRLVKIKILKSYLGDNDKKTVVDDLLAKTGAKLVDFIGFTVTLTKR